MTEKTFCAICKHEASKETELCPNCLKLLVTGIKIVKNYVVGLMELKPQIRELGTRVNEAYPELNDWS